MDDNIFFNKPDTRIPRNQQSINPISSTVPMRRAMCKIYLLNPQSIASATPTVLPLGTNGYVLTADNTTTTGTKWASIPTPATVGTVTQITDGSTPVNGSTGNFADAGHKHNFANASLATSVITGLDAALATIISVDDIIDKWWGNVMISNGANGETTTKGLILKSSGGKLFNLTVSEFGDISAIAV